MAKTNVEGTSYKLQTDDMMLTQQLVNAFPRARDRRKFTLGKPFTRCFSLLMDPSVSSSSPTSKRVKQEKINDTVPRKKHKKITSI